MARKDEDKNLEFIIPANFKENNVTANGIPYRNVAEAVVLVGLVVLILWFIPIPLNIKIIVGVVIGALLGIFALKGINRCSLSEYLIYMIKFKTSPKVYVRKQPYQKNNSNAKNDRKK